MKTFMLALIALSAQSVLAAPEVKTWVNPACARGASLESRVRSIRY